jgi:predicted signal transduction protein with EAL and GGDEF domain
MSARAGGATSKLVLAVAWLAVGLPLLWGVAQTVGKAAALFH